MLIAFALLAQPRITWADVAVQNYQKHPFDRFLATRHGANVVLAP